MMAEPSVIRQKGIPSDFWLIDSLFMLPKMLMPSTTIESPSMIKLCSGPKSGQLRWK